MTYKQNPRRYDPHSCPQDAKGQALIETLVVAAVLMPLVLITVLLGKYQSIQTASIAAARSLAFECTVRRDECSSGEGLTKLTQELAQRHLSRSTREIFSQDSVPDLQTGAERHALWTNRKGEGLLESFADTSASVSSGSFDAGVGVANGMRRLPQFDNAVELLSNLAGPGKFGLQLRDGLLTANVQVKASQGQPVFNAKINWFDGLPLTFNTRAAILVDDWSASKVIGPEADTVETRVSQGKRLAAALEATQDLAYLAVRASITLMGALGLDDAASKFNYHDMDLDVIPPDRRGIPAPADVTAPVFEGA